MISTARLRRAVRRETIGVDVLAALSLVGALIKWLGLAFLLPIGVALWYGESPWPFVLSGVVTGAFGIALERVPRGKELVRAREGFLVVALTWLLAAAVGALPYLLSGEEQLSSPVDAFFEAMSGFTTTGATVLADIPALDRSLLIWRQFTQWLGGIGIIVLALAVLPRLRVGGRQLFESEAPGPEVERLTTTIREAARRLWILYVALTAVMVGVLTTFAYTGVDDAMSFFDAVAHAFTTVPTAGFSTHNRGFEDFGAASQWTAVVFMILGGANFALLYGTIVHRRVRRLLRDEEFRLYVLLLVAATLALLYVLLDNDLHGGEGAVRHATFQAVSLMTTTGAASADTAVWPAAALVLLVGLMFIGGSAGSTAGSIKVVRHLFIGRILRRELDQTVHPEIVSPIRLNRTAVDERSLRAVVVFVLLYVGLFAAGALVITLDAAFAHPEAQVRPFEAISAAAATLGNVGPATGFAGPMGSFDPFSNVSKVVMIALMWLGRLEIIPVIVLFTKNYWRT